MRPAQRLFTTLVILSMLLLLYFCSCTAFPGEKADFDSQRKRMVETQLEARGIGDKAVLGAMRKVPRHAFVPAHMRSHSYEDRPLPIGEDQTISQPFIVAYMTELLHLRRDDRVLEVGTGSGYQAAVLAEIVKEVYSIEIIEALSRRARKTLGSLGYRNISLKWGDGYAGWKEHAPFDAIIVTAAAEELPPALIAQLRIGGRLCMPVGPSPGIQKLIVATKKQGGKVESAVVTEVLFVPLTRKVR